MRYWAWLCGVLGLVLVALGLYIFYVIYVWFTGAHYVETVTLLVIGIFVTRWGLLQMRVALAALVCTDIPAPQVEQQRVRTDRRVVSPGKTAPLGQT
jgi:hypothetical protein